MSTSSGNEFAHIPLAQLAASLTNPRTSFNPDRLQELADSIQASGVHQPILVRPLPGARVGDTGREVQFEIVAGERRFRACQIAGVATIPAMVRAMTDGEVLEVQIVENLQRDDLTELEEAEGYERLMAHSSLTAEEVGGKIGKSRSYVYARLKLLDLSLECKKALRQGQIDASRALLIARIPDGQLQIKALAEATRTVYNGDAYHGVRSLQTWLQQNVMLPLDRAPFKITDARLVESAGSCKDCPKRTGANPDLFADVQGADICTDPACYQVKSSAHRLIILAKAEARGLRMVDGTEAKSICYQTSSTLIGYSPLSQVREDAGGQRLGDLLRPIGQEHPEGAVLIENPWTKELIEAVPTEEAEAVLLARGLIQALQPKGKAADHTRELETLQNRAKRDTKSAVDAAVLQGVVQAVRATDDTLALALLGSSLLRAWLITKLDDSVSDKDMALALGYTFQDGEDENAGLIMHIKACSNAELHRAAAIVMALDDDRCNYRDYEPLVINTLTDVLAVPVKALTKEATAKVRSEYANQLKAVQTKIDAQKLPVPTTPLAQPPALPGAGAKLKNPSAQALREHTQAKMSAEQAQLGIAAALQKLEAEPDGSEAAPGGDTAPDQADRPQVNSPAQAAQAGFAVGQRVRVLGAPALRPVVALFAGKEGIVVGLDLSFSNCSLWLIRLDGRKGRAGGDRKFLAEELEVVS